MDMDKLLTEVASKIPDLAVLCWIVWAFLKAQEHGRKSNQEFIVNLHQEHMAARGESRAAIKENTESNREVSKAMANLERTISMSSRTLQ